MGKERVDTVRRVGLVLLVMAVTLVLGGGVAFIAALPVALALSGPLSFASMFGVFGLAWLALGYALWSQRVTPTERPSRVS